MIAKLKSGEVEFAIAGKNFACSNDPELTVRALCHEKLVFVVPKGHRLEGKFVEPKDPESITVMGYVAPHPLSYFVDKVLMNNQIKPLKKVEADSIDLIVKFVEEGLGAGIVSESGVRKNCGKDPSLWPTYRASIRSNGIWTFCTSHRAGFRTRGGRCSTESPRR